MLKIIFISALLVFLVSVMTGGDLLRSGYLMHRKVYPVTLKYFWFLMGSAVVALVLSVIVMQNWRYSSLVAVVIVMIVGCSIISNSVKPKKGQI
jgi:surface polysaccharide O-acyltransferase-like enzyme